MGAKNLLQLVPNTFRDSTKGDDVPQSYTGTPERDRRRRDDKGFKLESSTTLLTQHFSILRELRTYCLQLREGVKREIDGDSLKKIFEQVIHVLETGCHFWSLPVQTN